MDTSPSQDYYYADEQTTQQTLFFSDWKPFQESSGTDLFFDIFLWFPPLSYPITLKLKTNCVLVTGFFPRFTQFACFNSDWLVAIFSFVLIGCHKLEITV